MKFNLDFTSNAIIPSEYSLIFNEICTNNKNQFNDIITEITNNNYNNKDWLFSLPFSRNTLISHIYLKYCYLILLKKIVNNNNNLNYVYVDCYILKKQ